MIRARLRCCLVQGIRVYVSEYRSGVVFARPLARRMEAAVLGSSIPVEAEVELGAVAVCVCPGTSTGGDGHRRPLGQVGVSGQAEDAPCARLDGRGAC